MVRPEKMEIRLAVFFGSEQGFHSFFPTHFGVGSWNLISQIHDRCWNGWWFQICFMFTPILTHIFAKGLVQPPTSFEGFSHKTIVFGVWVVTSCVGLELLVHNGRNARWLEGHPMRKSLDPNLRVVEQFRHFYATPRKFNIFAPETWWLEDEFPFGSKPIFRG